MLVLSVCNGLKSIKSYNRITNLRMNNINDDDGATSGTFGFLGGLGVAGSFNIDYTLYILKTTGCNIIPSPKYGPYTLIAEESFSLLVIAGIFIWSLLVKKDTGKGLPGKISTLIKLYSNYILITSIIIITQILQLDLLDY